MAFNLENLRNDLEAACDRRGAELHWDPQHQTQRKIISGSSNEVRLAFTVRILDLPDADSIITPEKFRHLLLKLVSKNIFEFFGYEADFLVTTNPGRSFERSKPAATPEQMADMLGGGTEASAQRLIPCVVVVSTPVDLKEGEEEPLHYADKVERIMNYLVTIGAGKQLFIKASSEPYPDHDNRFECLVYAEHDPDEDSIAPLKVRLKSFANAVKEQIEQAEDEGATTHLSIGAHRSPRHITPQELSELIAKGYGASRDNIFAVSFELFYP